MRRLTEKFIENKLKHAKEKDMIEFELDESRKSTTFRYDSLISAITKFRPVRVGNYLFFNDSIYDIEKRIFIATIANFNNCVAMNLYNGGNAMELNKIIPINLLEPLALALLKVSPDKELLHSTFRLLAKESCEKMVREFVNLGSDVAYMKSEKFIEVNLENYTPNKKTLEALPFDDFLLVWYDYDSKLRGENHDYADCLIEPMGARIITVNTKNVDERLFEYFERHYLDKDSNRIPEKYIELYDTFYKFVMKNGTVYIIESDHFNGIAGPNGEVPFTSDDLLAKKIAYLLQYIDSELLGKLDKEEIEVEYYTNEKTVRGKWIQEQRKPCVVKGHVRRYKSGKVAFVRPHSRSGFNTNSGICIRF